MKTIYRTYIDYSAEQEREIELEISYGISPYSAATFNDPEEGGELEECNINVMSVDGSEPSHAEAGRITDELMYCKEFNNWVEEQCFDDYKKNGEYLWQKKNR
jgi:hypothetical protein